VLKGGISRERDVSLESGEAIAEALRDKQYAVTEIDVTDPEIPELDDASIDVVFVALHGRFGEDGQVQSLLEEKGVPFTGSGSQASDVGMDKFASKNVFREHDIPTPPFHTYSEGDRPVPPPCGLMSGLEEGDGFVIKPRSQGSSIGVTMVDQRNEIGKGVMKAREVESDILVEPRMEGPEVTVGILNGEALPVIQLELAREFYDYEAKYQDERTGYNLNPDFTEEQLQEMKDISIRAYEALGCEGQARADLILNDGKPYVLEINTIPGMTSHSLLPKAAKKAGLDFPELCEQILLSAFD
jgi:D-alanine-D-alanine ligase